MLSPDKLENAYAKVKEENWMFRSFLKTQKSAVVDCLVHELHKKLFADIDCTACANCCKSIVPITQEEEIEVMAEKLGLTSAEFKAGYIETTEEGFIISKKKCPFITAKGCSVYEYRPQNCVEYPYTNQKEILTRLVNLLENCAICSVVFEIFEQLKQYYASEFKLYKTGYHEFFGQTVKRN